MTNKPKIPACIIVDDEDREYFEQWQWRIGSQGYCVRTRRKSDGTGPIEISMHRVVLERKLGRPVAAGMYCDHRDGDRYNQSRSNLREVTKQQNQHNRTRAKGYYWDKARNKWQAQIRINGKQINLGYYDLEHEARAAYLAAKAIYHKIP